MRRPTEQLDAAYAGPQPEFRGEELKWAIQDRHLCPLPCEAISDPDENQRFPRGKLRFYRPAKLFQSLSRAIIFFREKRVSSIECERQRRRRSSSQFDSANESFSRYAKASFALRDA